MEMVPKEEKLRQEIKQKLSQINYEDGISKEEAIVIAQNFLIEKKVNVDHVLDKPTVKENELRNRWEITFKTTLKAKLQSWMTYSTIYVDRSTGKIRGGGAGPDL